MLVVNNQRVLSAAGTCKRMRICVCNVKSQASITLGAAFVCRGVTGWYLVVANLLGLLPVASSQQERCNLNRSVWFICHLCFLIYITVSILFILLKRLSFRSISLLLSLSLNQKVKLEYWFVHFLLSCKIPRYLLCLVYHNLTWITESYEEK